MKISLFLLFILFNNIAFAETFEVMGAIRNTGNGFQVISDSEHIPVNICNVTTTKTNVSFDFCGNAAISIHTLLVVPDETYAQKGISAGASVGLNRAVIIFGKDKLIEPSKLIESSGNFWIYGKFTK